VKSEDDNLSLGLGLDMFMLSCGGSERECGENIGSAAFSEEDNGISMEELNANCDGGTSSDFEFESILFDNYTVGAR
jgi:hypothetical protein